MSMQVVLEQKGLGRAARNQLIRTRVLYFNSLAICLLVMGVLLLSFLLYKLPTPEFKPDAYNMILTFLKYAGATLPISASILLHNAACKLSAQIAD